MTETRDLSSVYRDLFRTYLGQDRILRQRNLIEPGYHEARDYSPEPQGELRQQPPLGTRPHPRYHHSVITDQATLATFISRLPSHPSCATHHSRHVGAAEIADILGIYVVSSELSRKRPGVGKNWPLKNVIFYLEGNG
jgi:hypothetical protein